jgi:hypothetical protein
VDNGANMKKHIEFRKNNKYINNGDNIDIMLLLKIILDNENVNKSSQIDNLEWIFEFINPDMILDIKYAKSNNKITFNNLILQLNILLNNLSQETRETYIDIIKEELKYDLINNLICPNNKLELILYYLIPFINYEFNLNFIWLNNLFSVKKNI